MLDTIALVLAIALGQPVARMPSFHTVPLAQVHLTRWTHVCTSGPVVYRRKMADGDWHITLDDGTAKVVLEIKPIWPLVPPSKGMRIRACGVTRIDRGHRTAQYPAGWPELHPLLTWSEITSDNP